MSEEPWTSRAFWRLVVLNALGALMLAISWWFARSASSFESQERWVALGIGGLVLAGYGCATWLTGVMATTKAWKDELFGEVERMAMGAMPEGEPLRWSGASSHRHGSRR